MSKETSKTMVYSALEVANICGVVNQTTINWIRNGYLKAFCTPGGQYRVYLDDLVDFMTKRKMRIPPEIEAFVNNKIDKVPQLLIVDDERGLNSLLVKYLQHDFPGVKYLQAFNGFDAGAMLAKKDIDCVLLDLGLPGIDGFDICRRIHTSEEFGKPYVFVITAIEDDSLEEQLNKMGAVEFFKKPLNLVKISAAVKKHLNIN